jgi:SAM-dependent methyltransferase
MTGIGDQPVEGRVADDLGRLQWFELREHYLDSFLGEMKRQANLELITGWTEPEHLTGRVLKTDLFEEAFGPDAFLPDLQTTASVTVGIDVSLATAAAARRNPALEGCHVVVADVRQLPLKDAGFTLVASPSTLDHFRDPTDLGRSLSELLRISSPSGRLVVTLDNRQNIFDPLLRLAARSGVIPYFVGRSYTVGELRRELAEAGWRVLDTSAILHNPRLVATGLVALARRLRWPLLTRTVRRLLTAAQRFGKTRLRYRTGCFVAAVAVPWTSRGNREKAGLTVSRDVGDRRAASICSRSTAGRATV